MKEDRLMKTKMAALQHWCGSTVVMPSGRRDMFEIETND
jgi:hypothetical protein